MCYTRKYISKLNHGNACTVSKNHLHWHKFWSCEIFPSVSGFPSFLFKSSQSTYAHRSMWCWFCPVHVYKANYTLGITCTAAHLPSPISGIFRRRAAGFHCSGLGGLHLAPNILLKGLDPHRLYWVILHHSSSNVVI